METQKMSFQERTVITSLAVGAVFFYLLYTRVHVPLRDVGVDALGGFAGQAKQTLWLIGIGIVAQIIAVIVAEILYAIVTNSEDTDTTVDERDRHIEHVGDRYGNYLTGMMFIALLFAAAFGWTPEWVLLGVTYAFFFGSLLSSLIRVYQHRRGY